MHSTGATLQASSPPSIRSSNAWGRSGTCGDPWVGPAGCPGPGMQLSFDEAKRREAGQRLAKQPGREVNVAAKSGKRCPITVEDLAPRIDHALRNIDNRIELNRSPLLRLAAVER